MMKPREYVGRSILPLVLLIQEATHLPAAVRAEAKYYETVIAARMETEDPGHDEAQPG